MDDMISRQRAINVIERTRAYIGHNMERAVGAAFIEILNCVGEEIGQLPSAQLGTNLAEVGTDCISRQSVLDAITASINQYGGRYTTEQLNMWGLFVQMIQELPSAQPKRGKWIKTARWGRVYYCDQCRNYLDFDGVNAGRGSTNFCPNCGAKMEGTDGRD